MSTTALKLPATTPSKVILPAPIAGTRERIGFDDHKENYFK